MSAGSGVHHSEYNPSSQERVELFQIWIIPQTKGLTPRYEERDFRDLDIENRWALIVSGDGREGSMPIAQDASIKTARLHPGHTLVCDPIKMGHGRLLLVIDGKINACGYTLGRRDEMQVLGEESFEIMAETGAHLLLFDVPMEYNY